MSSSSSDGDRDGSGGGNGDRDGGVVVERPAAAVALRQSARLTPSRFTPSPAIGSRLAAANEPPPLTGVQALQARHTSNSHVRSRSLISFDVKSDQLMRRVSHDDTDEDEGAVDGGDSEAQRGERPVSGRLVRATRCPMTTTNRESIIFFSVSKRAASLATSTIHRRRYRRLSSSSRSSNRLHPRIRFTLERFCRRRLSPQRSSTRVFRLHTRSRRPSRTEAAAATAAALAFRLRRSTRSHASRRHRGGRHARLAAFA